MTSLAQIGLGCDISQKTIDIQLIDNQGNLINYCKINNNQSGFEQLIDLLPENSHHYHICMEATGNYYEHFADYMVEQNYQVTVVNPLKIKKFAESEFQKTKTDKQDAKLIAQYCQEKLLNKGKAGTYRKPTEQQYQVKRLLSYIHELKQQKTALKNRYCSSKDDFIIAELQKQIEQTNGYIQSAEQKLTELTNSEAKQRLKSIPSISETTATILIHYLTLFDFKSGNKFVAFAGLSPHQAKSGTSVNRKEKLTRYGNRILKTALYMPALVAYRMGVFKNFVDNLKKRGKSGKLIIIAIMRKLAMLAWTLYTKNEEYRKYA
ncbi:transposase [Kingella negevensis]|uniref:transposase n=1 Tax=Kingella negevensis TaxID=1522312 RepID=UPI002542B329|nr:transposase [Kingella negevensis]WII92511.1 transposase [Kingella negevensis]